MPAKQDKMNLTQQRVVRRNTRLAKEYFVDFNIEMAALRCGMDPSEGIRIWESQLFQLQLVELVDLLDPDTIMTRNEILVQLKKEAFNTTPRDANSATRIAALKELAKLLGIVPAEEINMNHKLSGQATVNISIAAPAPPVKHINGHDHTVNGSNGSNGKALLN